MLFYHTSHMFLLGYMVKSSSAHTQKGAQRESSWQGYLNYGLGGHPDQASARAFQETLSHGPG